MHNNSATAIVQFNQGKSMRIDWTGELIKGTSVIELA